MAFRPWFLEMVEIYWERLHTLELVLELFAETASITGQIVDWHSNDWQWVSLPKMGKRYQITENSVCYGNEIFDPINMIPKWIVCTQRKGGNRSTVVPACSAFFENTLINP
jgi:hypothetical protein